MRRADFVEAVRTAASGKPVALGTVVAEDGFVLTKHSELTEDLEVRLADGRIYEAKLHGLHKATDLAMLKIEAKDLPPIEWKDSYSVGIPAVEKVFEQHGGGLDVSSAEGEGATFTGWFPVERIQSAAA